MSAKISKEQAWIATPVTAPTNEGSKPLEFNEFDPAKRDRALIAEPLESNEHAEAIPLEHSAFETEGEKVLTPDQLEMAKRNKRSQEAYVQQIRIIDRVSDAILEKNDIETSIANRILSENLVTEDIESARVLGVDETGQNKTLCMTLKDGTVAFGKSIYGEALLDNDGYLVQWNVAKKEFVRLQEWNDETQLYQEPATPRADLAEVASLEYRQNMMSALQREYGLTDEERFQVEERWGQRLALRPDNPPGESIMREMVVSQLAAMHELKRFQATVLRKDKLGNIISAQVGAKIEDEQTDPNEKKKLVEIPEATLEAMLFIPMDRWPDYFGKEVANELIDAIEEGVIGGELCGFQDGSHLNMLTDPKTGKTRFIDYSNSFSPLRGVRIDGESITARNNRGLRSLPLEVFAKNPNRKLSARRVAALQRDYAQLQDPKSAESAVLDECFKIIFPHEKIAKAQREAYVNRIKYMAEHGRPMPKAEIQFEEQEVQITGPDGKAQLIRQVVPVTDPDGDVAWNVDSFMLQEYKRLRAEAAARQQLEDGRQVA